jgi:hypothetical protein
MIRRKPFLPQALRKFKRFQGEGDGLVPASVARFDPQPSCRSFVPQFLGLGGERLGVDLFEQPQVRQFPLKPDDLGVSLLEVAILLRVNVGLLAL